MRNKEVANVLFEIANYLESKNIKWKPQAYRKAARSIQNLDKEITKVKNLDDIPGVGEALSKKIKEYLKTGTIKEYKNVIKKQPKYFDLLDIETLGLRRAKELHEKLNIKTKQDLKKAIKQHKIAKLPGFGEKSEKKLLESLETNKSKRYPLKEILPIANKIKSKFKKLKEVKRIEVGGSIRRKQSTVKDIDILVSSSNPKKVINHFVKLSEANRVLSKGPTRAAIKLKNGINSDLRVVPDDSFGAALQYFTGNKDHNIKLRNIAIRKGFKLNEYGLFDKKTNKKIAGKNEEDIYKKLGLKTPKPEERLG